jgi:hypothetical protein
MEHVEALLIDRHLELRQHGKAVSFGNETRHPYSSVQSAVDTVLSRLSMTWNIDGNSTQVIEQLVTKRARLTIRAEARELAVARLHLISRYSLQSGVAFEPNGVSESIYETFGLNSDTEVANRTLALIADWTRELADHAAILVELSPSAEEWKTRETSVLQTLKAVEGKPSPPRIAVVGAVGAGKSTFLNAVLGRHIVPTGTEITTSSIVELRFAAERSDEGFEVVWMSHAAIDAHLASIDTELGRVTSKALSKVPENDIFRNTHLTKLGSLRAQLQQAKDCTEALAKREPLDRVERYVSANGDAAAGVERAIVYVHHPLLRHVTLVDTPGLRDPDEWRQKLALEELAQSEAWVYLVNASEKVSTSIVDDINIIREQSHNQTGVVLYTKADTCSDRVDQVIRERTNALARWGLDAPSAPISTRAITVHDSPDTTQLGQELFTLCSRMVAPGAAWGHQNSLVQGLLNHDLTNGLSLRDYLLDGAGLVKAMQTIGSHVSLRVMRRRHDQARSELVDFAETVRRSLAERVANTTSILEKWTDLESLRSQQSIMREERDALVSSLHNRRSAIERAYERFRTLANNLEVDSDLLAEKALASLQSHLSEQYRGALWGDRTFPIFQHFDLPLAKEYGSHLQQLLRDAATSLFAAAIGGIDGDERDRLQDQYQSSVRPILQLDGILFHSTRDIVVQDYEALLESYETTKARMMQAAHSHIRNAKSQLRKRAVHVGQTSLVRLRQHALRVLQKEKATIVALGASANEIQRRVEELRASIPGDREVMEARRSSILKAIAAVDAFLAKVEHPFDESR